MNQWKSVVWMAAGVAALTVVGAFTAKPLLAQIKPALVQNVDEPGRSPYSSFVKINSGTCVDNSCALFFAAVPAGKRLIATDLTGRINVISPGVVSLLILAGAPSGDSQVQIPTTLLAGTFAGLNMNGVNANLHAFFAGGSQPGVGILSTTPIENVGVEGMLTLSGYLVDCSGSSCAALVH